MKTLLIGLLCIFSLASIANEYVCKKTTCEISGTVESIFVEKRSLPNAIKVQFETVEIRGKRKKGFQHLEQSIDKTPKSYFLDNGTDDFFSTKILEKLEMTKISMTNVLSNNWYKVTFESFSLEEIELLLKELGATNIPNLLDSNISKKKSLKLKEGKRQIHFPSDIEDGLSYHIEVSCY